MVYKNKGFAKIRWDAELQSRQKRPTSRKSLRNIGKTLPAKIARTYKVGRFIGLYAAERSNFEPPKSSVGVFKIAGQGTDTL
ncbi:hypothetical protein O4H53_22175 [Sulfitobacter sp. G21635-S1]|uniref:hypothetical protein n=1 Tax=Sulfitobacter sp. G21635-S1 TaxID=3014043 RepID=UPI0022AF6D85|nr:hypothetical protein [Sulfitobacter sp. G21635-S1]MCZ4258262.1 hypothetical protein [Sulfitobacter sp. G21635-S1]